MIAFFQKHPEKVYVPLLEHAQITGITLLFSVAIAALLTLAALRWKRVQTILEQIFAVLYSVPSLAMFALLIPVTGLGRTTAVIVLTIYNQYLLMKNFLTGLQETDPAVVEAARGIGMSWLQTVWRIQLPLARKAIFAGIRLAVISTIGIGTIAASINAGGLGSLLLDGLRTMNTAKIFWGAVLSAALAVSMNALLGLIERHI